MPPAPQSGGGQSDNSAGILWGVAAVFAAIAFVWFVFKKQIISFYLVIKLYEVHLMSYITGSPKLDQLGAVINAALANPSMVSFRDLMIIGSGVGDWLRFPLVVILVLLAFALYFNSSARVFRRIYSMKTLAKLEKDNWPQITPVVDQDLLAQDIDKGRWAMALTPMQFCKRYRLIAEVRPDRASGLQQAKGRIEVVLLRGEANKVFAMQLGPLWKNIDKLPHHVRALFAVFAARINGDSKSAEKLIKQMNVSSGGKLDFSGADDIIKKYGQTKLVKEVLARHAYVFTVMASMIQEARADGVVASADFLWLKPMDRKLWYTLNCVGRQTPYPEVSGIFAHWLAEKEVNRKLFVPVVEKATNALEMALKEVVYNPDEE